jgi:hypothetical protein
MNALFPASETPIPIEAQIAEVERELAMREKVFPRWIDEKKLKPENAARCMNAMRAVLATLQSIKEKKPQ